jgi:hypothetical protein
MRFRENEQTDTLRSRAIHQRLALPVANPTPWPKPTAEQMAWAKELHAMYNQDLPLPSVPFSIPFFTKNTKLTAWQIKVAAQAAAFHMEEYPSYRLPDLKALDFGEGLGGRFECGIPTCHVPHSTQNGSLGYIDKALPFFTSSQATQ